MNSREAISTRKCDPPFFTQVSVSCTRQISIKIQEPGPKKTDIEGAELCVRILVAYAPFEGAHGILCRHGFRPYEIGDLEIEGDVLSGRSQGSAPRL
jgi:hypothetical protein